MSVFLAINDKKHETNRIYLPIWYVNTSMVWLGIGTIYELDVKIINI